MKYFCCLALVLFTFFCSAQRNGISATSARGIEIKNLGNQINSEFIDYAPVVAADGSLLIYTSRKPVSRKKEKNAKDRIYRAVFDTLKNEWLDGIPYSKAVNIVGQNSSAVYVSPDAQFMLIYRDDINTNGDIFKSRLVGHEWTEPESIGEPINSVDREFSACLSPDEKRIYFVSDRQGGMGGLDIWFSDKDSLGGWGQPVNMGPTINSPADEDGVFIHAGGNALFFSCNGRNTLGGFDVFMSLFSDATESWKEPVNLGSPVNTAGDDVYFTMEADGKKAYYSSIHKDSYGQKDIYQVTYSESIIDVNLLLLKGRIADKANNLLDSRIVITDKATKKVVLNYFPNLITGEYLLILPSGRNFEFKVAVAGYPDYIMEFRNENLVGYHELKRDFIMDLPRADSMEVVQSTPPIQTNATGDSLQLTANQASLVHGLDNQSVLSIETGLDTSTLVNDSRFDVVANANNPIPASDSVKQSSKYALDSGKEKVVFLVVENQGNTASVDTNALAGNNRSQTQESVGKNAVDGNIGELSGSGNKDVVTSEKTVKSQESLESPNNKQAEKQEMDEEVIKAHQYVRTKIKKEEVNNDLKEAKEYISRVITKEYKIPEELKYTADIQNANVFGRVLDNNGKPLKAQIEVIDSKSRQVLGTYSNAASTGEFRLKLQKGAYRLIVSKNCYLFNSFFITVISSDSVKLKDIKMKPLQNGTRIILDNILFDYTKAEIRPQSFFTLDRTVYLLKSNPTLKIEIAGHTDNTYSIELNQRLSEDRAKAVMDYLVRKGIDSTRLTYKGYGFSQPVATNETKEGRQLNRRTELKVMGEDLKSEQIKEIARIKTVLANGNYKDKIVPVNSRFMQFDDNKDDKITYSEVNASIDLFLTNNGLYNPVETIALVDLFLE